MSAQQAQEAQRFPVWNLNSLYSSLSDPQIEKDIQAVSKLAEEFQQYRILFDRAKLSPDSLAPAIEKYEKIQRMLHRVYAFAHLSIDVDLENTQKLALYEKIRSTGAEIQSELQFFTHGLSRLARESYERLVQSEILGSYRYFFQSLKERETWLLSDEEERIIRFKNLHGSGSWSKFFTEIESTLDFGTLNVDGETIKLSKSKIRALKGSPDPEVRAGVYQRENETYGEMNRYLVYTYRSIVSDYQTELERLRSREDALAQSALEEEITEEAILNLMNATKANYPLFRKYHSFKKKSLDLSRYGSQDFRAPLMKMDSKVSYSTACSQILESLKRFDPDYESRGRGILGSERIHSLPGGKKRTGAYCSPTPEGPFILMNYEENYDSVFTLAHELGHAIHFSYADENQPFVLRFGTKTGAETASQFNELILLDHYMETLEDPQARLLLLDEQVGSMVSVLFRQTLISNFELKCHEIARERNLDAQTINEIWLNMVRERNGVEIQTPDMEQYGWSKIPHIFHFPFYCWTYSMSMLVVLSLYALYTEKTPGFIDGYKDLLRAGGSDKCSELLKNNCAVDLEDPSFFEKGFSLVNSYVDRLEKEFQSL